MNVLAPILVHPAPGDLSRESQGPVRTDPPLLAGGERGGVAQVGVGEGIGWRGANEGEFGEAERARHVQIRGLEIVSDAGTDSIEHKASVERVPTRLATVREPAHSKLAVEDETP